MATEELTYPPIPALVSSRHASHWQLCKRFLCASLLLLLAGALRWYLHEDYRADQFRTLAQTAGMASAEDMRRYLKEDSISREDFPKMLFHFIACDHPPSVQGLVEVGMDLMVRNAQGQTPLQMARHLGRTEIVQMLRQAGAKE